MTWLVGAVAHDFNNLLTVIVSFAELAQRNPQNTQLLTVSFETIMTATERASGLTRQLLAFGRRDAARPITFDARRRLVMIGGYA